MLREEKMADGTFEVGDIVILKSGGPPMTVTETWEDDGVEMARCSWFLRNGKREEDVFPCATIRKPKMPVDSELPGD